MAKLKGRWVLFSMLAGLMLLVAACSNNGSNSGTATSGSATSSSAAPVKVGMALTGPKDDKGYNQSYYDGLNAAAKKYGLEVQVLDNVNSPQAYTDAMTTLAQDNQVVIGVGAEFGKPALTVGPQYPDTTFLIANGEMSPSAPNVYAYFVRQGVPAYPAGIIAAKLTKTNQIGFIGGTAIPPTFASRDAFKAGAQSITQSIQMSSAVIGDFYDATKAKQAATAQIDAGADVIYAFLDGDAVTAVVQAASEAGKKVLIFTPIYPRCDEFKGVDVGTATLSSTAQVEAMMGDYVNQTLPTEPVFYGVEDPSIQTFVLCPSFATPELTKLVNDALQGINDGSISLPKGV